MATKTISTLATKFSAPGLAALFRIGEDQLDASVDSCYREHLEYDRNRFWGGLPTSFLVPDTA